jgi:chemotaxis protein methyltransferase CheR
MPTTAKPLNSVLQGICLNEESYNISDRDFNAIRAIIFREAGISLSDGKRALVCSRLAKRLRHLSLNSHADYLDYLATRDPAGEERQVMVNCLTTNKTDFFREAHHFQFLRENVFPQIERAAEQGKPRRLRIWSSACSTGEEPYSIAMTILDHFGSIRGWDIQVFASDINTEVLQKAREGIYALDRVNGVDERIKRKYFLRGAGRWAGFCQVRPEVRRLVRFGQINLMDERWPLKNPCDVIFCRNVLIYFDISTQQQLLPRMVRQLTNSGYLMLGHSENVHWLIDLVTPRGQTVYQRKTATRAGKEAWLRHANPPQRPAAMRPPAPPPEPLPLKRHSIIAGEYFAAAAPSEISTNLGSCVAACLFDPQTGIGGMNHFMLPESDTASFGSARYGVHAMELLINAIMKLGGDRRRLKAKVFGGANVMCFRCSMGDVGSHNCQFILRFLETERIPLVAKCLRGRNPLRVLFHPHSGRAFVKAIPRQCRRLNGAARCHQCPLKNLTPLPHGDVTLF